MLDRIYVLTLTLLVTHQIDAAYWHEWEMFLLPGGIQFFDLFNLGIIPILLIGYKAVILRTSRGYYYSWLLAGLGILTALIHSGFYLHGYRQFTLLVSALIIVLCAVSGIIQMILTIQEREKFQSESL